MKIQMTGKKTIGTNFITICIIIQVNVLWFQLVIYSIIIQVHGYVNDDNENGVCA